MKLLRTFAFGYIALAGCTGEVIPIPRVPTGPMMPQDEPSVDVVNMEILAFSRIMGELGVIFGRSWERLLRSCRNGTIAR